MKQSRTGVADGRHREWNNQDRGDRGDTEHRRNRTGSYIQIVISWGFLSKNGPVSESKLLGRELFCLIPKTYWVLIPSPTSWSPACWVKWETRAWMCWTTQHLNDVFLAQNSILLVFWQRGMTWLQQRLIKQRLCLYADTDTQIMCCVFVCARQRDDIAQLISEVWNNVTMEDLTAKRLKSYYISELFLSWGLLGLLCSQHLHRESSQVRHMTARN